MAGYGCRWAYFCWSFQGCSWAGRLPAARGSWLERWIVDDATVRTSVAVIDVLTPQAQAQATARGASIEAPTGDINVRNGCEGTEIYFLWIAALATYPFPWRLRLSGLLGGLTLAFTINQARLLALFYALHADRALFEQVHGLLAPLAMVTAMVALFVPAVLLLWAVDVPLILLASLWQLIFQVLDPGRISALWRWAAFLQGGGELALAAALGVLLGALGDVALSAH